MKIWGRIFKSDKKHIINSQNINTGYTLKQSLEYNTTLVKDTLGGSSDIVVREFSIGERSKIKIAVLYIEGLADKNLINDFILKSLIQEIRSISIDPDTLNGKDLFKTLKDLFLQDGQSNNISDFGDLYNHLLSGDTIILIDGYTRGYVLGSKKWEDRGVQEPNSQTVVRGPRDSFTETLGTNTSLLRRRIKDTNLWIETKQIGRITKTDVAIAYIKGIANDKIIQEVRERLNKIDIDGILESGYIEELIEDKAYTPFPTIYNTERPDAAAAGLLEGRVAILVDGTPFVLLVPALFVQFFQTPEDYYQRFDISTMIRVLRYFCFFVALLTPAIYIAITTFHQEMLPTPLLISIASQREGVPFTAFFEALLMEIVFEILREAGIRMPRVIGPAISIVGALVIGEAAVQAGIVSAVMVIVVSLTAISSFVFPSYNLAIAVRILRFVFMLLSATFGLYGISVGLVALVLHLSSLRSFGIPYMSPAAPFNLNDQKDAILRLPLWSMFTRPHLLSKNNIIRQQRPSKAKPRSSSRQ
ncbi:MAG: spore germination protein [Bacillota bacterium]